MSRTRAVIAGLALAFTALAAHADQDRRPLDGIRIHKVRSWTPRESWPGNFCFGYVQGILVMWSEMTFEECIPHKAHSTHALFQVVKLCKPHLGRESRETNTAGQ
jgi:hypothetical protein